MRAYITCLFIILNFSVNAQLELGLKGGGTNYLGDLAPSNLRTSLGETKLHLGVFMRYHFFDAVAVRAGANYGKIGSSDANANPGSSRIARNLSFRSNIFEGELSLEIHPLGLFDFDFPLSPYFFGGVAAFRFNPQAEYEGVWYDLQPLGTEGQGLEGSPEKYNLVQLSIPAGIGLKYSINENWLIGIESGLRKTFTDYLDDLSTVYPDLDALSSTNGTLAAQLSWRGGEINPDAIPPSSGTERGDADDLDWYIFSSVYVAYRFTGGVGFGGGQRRNVKLGCPTF